MSDQIIKWPFGAAETIALTATGAQALTITNNMTIVDGVTVIATGNRTLNLTIAATVTAGARIFVKSKTTATETTVIDKNFLFVRGSIRNVDLYVKKILTTKCGVLYR